MTSPLAQIANLVRLLPRAAVLTLLIAAPVLAMPGIRGGEASGIIEAPVNKQSGAGLILMVSLQRS